MLSIKLNDWEVGEAVVQMELKPELIQIFEFRILESIKQIASRLTDDKIIIAEVTVKASISVVHNNKELEISNVK